MVFNSISFLIFFPVVAALYAITPRRWRWLLFLLASCYFYMAFIPSYILILFALITIDYFLGIAIEKADGRKRRMLLFVSICSNLGTLFIFKYYNFFNVNVAALAHFLGWNYQITLLYLILPLGLSYHVFQSLSYVIEVYYGRFPAERHYGIYALYVMFFPQLVAGPIEKPQWLLPQLHSLKNSSQDINQSNARSGLERMAWGFFKKVIIADNIGYFVDAIYNNLHTVHGPLLFAGMVAFAIQLYTDFSVYSDIAVGAAQFFGITLINNFNFPFFSTSVAELWRRWHISLSTWARDYVYYPLAVLWASSIGRLAVYGAVLVTFLLIGLWHGAAWTFVIMGAFFGGYIAVGTITKPWRVKIATAIGITKFPKLHAVIQATITFILSCIGWVFFRAQTVSDGFYLVDHLLSGWTHVTAPLPVSLPEPTFTIALIAAVILFIAEFLEFHYSLFTRTREVYPWTQWIAYYGFVLIFMLFFLTTGTYQQKAFIYFQF